MNSCVNEFTKNRENLEFKIWRKKDEQTGKTPPKPSDYGACGPWKVNDYGAHALPGWSC
jgi:hypothetical protein